MKFAKPLFVFGLMFALAPIAVIGCSNVSGGDEGAGGGGGSGGDSSGGAGKGGSASGGSSGSGGSSTSGGSGGSSAAGGTGGTAAGGKGGAAAGGAGGTAAGGAGGTAAGGAGGAAAGGAGGMAAGGAGGASAATTFTMIYETILSKTATTNMVGCMGGGCHETAHKGVVFAAAGGAKAAYDSLKGKLGATPAASIFYNEVKNKEMPRNQGTPSMPIVTAKLSDAQVKMIADWITAGAKFP
jgi:hypothetical protein